MAKRLTDTEKWKDDWFISLNNDYRIIWQWLLDNCNHAGICKRSINTLNLMCNTNISESDLIVQMQDRVLIVNNLWFIPKFLKFQYLNLTSSKPVIVSVRNQLIKHGCDVMIPKSFGNDYLIIKDKDKDKELNVLENTLSLKNSIVKPNVIFEKNNFTENGKGNFNSGESVLAKIANGELQISDTD